MPKKQNGRLSPPAVRTRSTSVLRPYPFKMDLNCYEIVNPFHIRFFFPAPFSAMSKNFNGSALIILPLHRVLRCCVGSGAMSVRYLSAENAIAAAGAAFACPDDDYSDLASARSAAHDAMQSGWSGKRLMAKLLLAFGIILA
jgi:hypothetical protein